MNTLVNKLQIGATRPANRLFVFRSLARRAGWRLLLAGILLLNMQYCEKLEELGGPLVSGQKVVDPEVEVDPNAPGRGPDGGPDEYTFWGQNRQVEAPNSLAAFYQVPAEKLAFTDHFVLYREKASASRMDSAQAMTLLLALEPAWENLVQIYGGGTLPDVQKTGRVVILALDIWDDYSSENSSYISGYFAPRDLYNDEFTTSLFTDPDIIEQYNLETVATLQGQSNENALLYLDLEPFFNGQALGGDRSARELARDLAAETLLHESSHLFSYYKRVVENKQANFDTWIAEGTAEQAPQLLAGLLENQKQRMDQLSQGFVRATRAQGPSLLELDSLGNSLVGYLQSNLFFNYIRHRTNSLDKSRSFMEEVVLREDPTVVGLEEVFGDTWTSSTVTFSDIYRDWVLATYLASTGRTLTDLKDHFGLELPLGDGSEGTRKFNYSYNGAGIDPVSGSGPVKFQTGSLALNYDQGEKCIRPAAFITTHYTIIGDETVYQPAAAGMENGLEIIQLKLNGNSVSGQLFYPSSNIPLNAYTEGDQYEYLVYNPGYDASQNGDCTGLMSGDLPMDERNIAAWIGDGQVGWQTGNGAPQGNLDDELYRPRGVAFSLTGVQGSVSNYIYVADSINDGVSRWNLDTGEFEGRIGSTELNVNCTGDDSSRDGWKTNEGQLEANYCRRSFNTPMDVAVDSQGYLYVADRANNRIVKWDSQGNFMAWLGHPSDDSWQTIDPLNVGTGGDYPEYATNPIMFSSPYAVHIDESGSTPYMYVVHRGTSRVTRHNLTTGEYLGYIGNGRQGWNTTDTYLTGNRSAAAGYFRFPNGMTTDANYIYVADEQNNRISRWTLDGYQKSVSGSTDEIFLGGGYEGWHSEVISYGDRGRYLYYPSDVTYHNGYLYIADRQNDRLVRWTTNGTFAGWIGGGETEWQLSTDVAVSDAGLPGYDYPPLLMLEPEHVAIAPESLKGSNHDYLFSTSIYNARVSRWNLDCVEDNAAGDCGQ